MDDKCPGCGGEASQFAHPFSPALRAHDERQVCANCDLPVPLWSSVRALIAAEQAVKQQMTHDMMSSGLATAVEKLYAAQEALRTRLAVNSVSEIRITTEATT
jgi:hypothetical protein